MIVDDTLLSEGTSLEICNFTWMSDTFLKNMENYMYKRISSGPTIHFLNEFFLIFLFHSICVECKGLMYRPIDRSQIARYCTHTSLLM